MDDHFARVLEHSLEDEQIGIGTKRPRDSGIGDERAKSRRDMSTKALSKQSAEIAALLARAEADSSVETLDARALKSMAHALGKSVRKNAVERSKYCEEPAKFMDSEIALHEEVSKWHSVAALPDLYSHVLELDVVPLLLTLLTHENMDIRLDVIHVLAELTDAEDDEKALVPVTTLVNNLISLSFPPLLINTLDELTKEENPTEEVLNGVYHALQILENTLDVVPSISTHFSSNTLMWHVLLRLIQVQRPFSSLKLYSSEILSILVQDSTARQAFLDTLGVNGVDSLLQTLAPYRKKNPQDEEEQELMENLVNVLSTLLLERVAQDHFRSLEGFELMIRCLKDKELVVAPGALKVVDVALMHHRENGEHFVVIGGLKAVFAIFMGKKKFKHRKEQNMAHVVSILASMALILTPDASSDGYARFHIKFTENEMEKMDRLVDLWNVYDGEEEDVFLLQCLAVIMAVVVQQSKKLLAYLMIKCHERQVRVEKIVAVLEIMLNEVDREEKQEYYQQLETLVAAFKDQL